MAILHLLLRQIPHTLVLEYVSPATKLLQKRRQMFEIQESLEQQRKDFKSREEVFKERESKLIQKDAQLQESLVRFSKFLQENENKLLKAEKRATEEIKIRQAKEIEMQQLMQQLSNLKEESQKTSEILEKNIRYQEFLEGVVEVSDDFQEVGDILTRYATQKATNEDIKEQQKKYTDLAESMRVEIQAYTKQKTDQILDLNNQISKLKSLQEEKEVQALNQQLRKDYNLQLASQRTLEYGQVIISTDNLFNRCRQIFGHALENDPIQQLDFIGNCISDLALVIRTYKDQQKKKEQDKIINK